MHARGSIRARGAGPWLWFIPLLVIMGGVLAYPWVWTVVLSLHEWDLLRFEAGRWVGAANFRVTLADPVFVRALQNSLSFTAVTTALEVALGMALALLLRWPFPLRRVFVVGLSLPFMLTPTMVGLTWKLLLHGQWGVLSFAGEALFGRKLGWLSDPALALPTVMLVEVWQHTSWVFVVLWAGLQAMPPELHEAGQVDGASAWQSLVHITLPYLRPLLVIAVLFRAMFGLRAFDVVYALFRSGGPANAAQVLGVYLYEKFRLTFDLGISSAVSLLVLAITVALTAALVLRIYRESEQP